MAIHTFPHDTQPATLVFEFERNWSWPDFYQAVDQFNADAGAVEATRMVIFDFSQVRKPPENLLTHCPVIMSKLPPSVEQVVVVSFGNMMSTIHQLVEMLQRNTQGPALCFLSHNASISDAIQPAS